MQPTVESLLKGSPKFTRKNAAVLAFILLVADEVLEARGEDEPESLDRLLSKWFDPNAGLWDTIATGKQLQGAVGREAELWYNNALGVVRSLPASVIKAAGSDPDVREAAGEPEAEPPAAPSGVVDYVPTNPDLVDTRWVVADKHIDRITGKTITVLKDKVPGGKYLVQEEGNPKPFRLSYDELKTHYTPVFENIFMTGQPAANIGASPWGAYYPQPANGLIGGRRKTRRGKRKVRRTTKKRRAKSLRRR